jgi:hypothetical protein
MLEWIVIIGAAAMAVLAFFFLFMNSPVSATTDHKQSTRSPRTTEKKQKKPAKKHVKEAVYDDDATSRIVACREEDKDILRHYAGSAEDGEKTFAPSHSVQRTKKDEKREKVVMPSNKQINRDLKDGFVVVAKKGSPPLTADQKKERDAARLKEEQDKLQKEKDNAEREKKRQKERQDKATVPGNAGVSQEELKKQFDKKREDSAKKAKEAAGRPAGQVKNYAAPKSEESRPWGANVETSGEDGYTVEQDYSDYPRLQNAE